MGRAFRGSADCLILALKGVQVSAPEVNVETWRLGRASFCLPSSKAGGIFMGEGKSKCWLFSFAQGKKCRIYAMD